MSFKSPVSDRRVVRTREAVHAALIQLILERGYDAITVNEIIARSNVARSTFYAHHSGKDSVLQAGVGSLREHLTKSQRELRAASGGRVLPLAFSLIMFEHADGHRDLYQALLGDRGGMAVLGSIRQMIGKLIQQELEQVAGKTPRRGSVPLAAMVRFTSDAFMSILAWWLEAKPRPSPAEGDRIFRQLVGPSLAASGFGPG